MDLVTFVRRQVLVVFFHMQHPVRFWMLHFILERAQVYKQAELDVYANKTRERGASAPQ
jgi:hypothetical protein